MYKNTSILIVSLWIILLLSTLVVILGYNIRQKMSLIKHLENKDKVDYLLDAAVKKAILEIKKAKDSFVYLKPSRKDLFKEDEIGFSDRLSVNRFLGRFDNIDIFYGIFDEERNININEASLSLLKNLFKFIGLDDIAAQELSASIIDWRDEDSFLAIPLGSAEDSYYRSLEFPYEAKDSHIEVLEELLLVKGINPDIFEKIEKYITIYGNGAININTASPDVLLILGLDQDTIDKIISFRKGEDGVLGTKDDNFFESIEVIIPKLTDFYKLTDSQLLNITRLIENRLIDVNSNYFNIIVISKLNNKIFRRAKAIVNREGKILSWQEG